MTGVVSDGAVENGGRLRGESGGKQKDKQANAWAPRRAADPGCLRIHSKFSFFVALA
jgi:hypothetical protein